MVKITREQIFAQAARKLRSDFEELANVPHNALKGQEAEKIVRAFIDAHVPKRFSTGAGFILDITGAMSPQTDVIIYDAFNCPKYRASEDASIFPSNNVAAVIEVKSRLDGAQLRDAWKKISDIKSLRKAEPPNGPILSRTAGFLFAFDSRISLESISKQYAELLRTRSLGNHIDAICVLDEGILTLTAKLRSRSHWSPIVMEGFGGEHAEGTHIAVSAMRFGDNTLDAFFRLLLPRLTFFWHVVDHPGFGFQDIAHPDECQVLRYVTSCTTEQDPERRDAKLREYANEVREEFSETGMRSNRSR